MPNVVSDIVVTNAVLWYSNPGTALPATSVAVGASWGGGWTQAGFTKEPLKCTYEFDVVESMIQESLGPVARRKSSESLKIETVLAELSADALNLAWGGAVTQVPPGAGQVGYEEITFGDQPILTVRQWGFEGQYVDEDGATFPIRAFIYRATAEAGGEIEHGKETQTGIPFKLAALEDMAKAAGQRLWKWQRILEPATS